MPTPPELATLPKERVQRFYGAQESDTACTRPELQGAALVETKGGHHFDGDYAALARTILKGLDGAG